MTVSTTANKVLYTLTGATTNFTFTFPIFAETDLVVIRKDTSDVETTLVLTTDYTISSSPWTSGGTVTTVTNYSDGTLIIKRVLPRTQATDYTTSGKFPADSHESALDKNLMLIQECFEELDRTLQLPEGTSLSSLLYPVPVANELLGWNSSADGIENKAAADLSLTTVSSFMNTLLTRSTAALARTDLDTPGLTVANVFTKSNYWKVGSATASATTVTLPTDGNMLHITGTTAITNFTHITGDGPFFLIFDGALTLTYSGTVLDMPGDANITTAAGDSCILIQDGTVWRIVAYFKASGNPVALDEAGIIAAGALGSGAIDSSGMFATGVVDQSAIGSSAVGSSEVKLASNAQQTTSVATGSGGSIAMTGGTLSLINSISCDTTGSDGLHLGGGDAASGTIGFYNNGASGKTAYVEHRYFTSSPPYGTADGQIPLFVYLERDTSLNILGISVSLDPIWANHGPTSLDAYRYDRISGRAYKKVQLIETEFTKEELKEQKRVARLSGDNVGLQRIRNRLNDPREEVEIEITQDYKNSDMNTHPHPWMYNADRGSEFILLDPQNTLTLWDEFKDGEDIVKLIMDGKVNIGSEINRIVPQGMKSYSFTF